MMMQMVGAFAEFERAMLKERTQAGLDAARKEGRIGGRPPKLKLQQRLEIVKLEREKDGGRCGTPVRCPSGNGVAAIA
jgi:DNA invertase Pin-like site-specific DNA recombinase